MHKLQLSGLQYITIHQGQAVWLLIHQLQLSGLQYITIHQAQLSGLQYITIHQAQLSGLQYITIHQLQLSGLQYIRPMQPSGLQYIRPSRLVYNTSGPVVWYTNIIVHSLHPLILTTLWVAGPTHFSHITTVTHSYSDHYFFNNYSLHNLVWLFYTYTKPLTYIGGVFSY